MSLSNYLEGKYIDHLFNKDTLTGLDSAWVALSSTEPSDSGTNVTEPTENGYARLGVATANMTRSGNTISNDNEETFPESTGAWDSDSTLNLQYAALYDDSSGGNMLASGSLTTPRSVDADGVTLRFAAGQLSFSLD